LPEKWNCRVMMALLLLSVLHVCAAGQPVDIAAACAVEHPVDIAAVGKAACSVCDAFAGNDGFFSVAIDCLTKRRNETYRLRGFPVGDFLLHDENWMKNVLPGCLTTLISSLGTSRPASFFRHGLPTSTYVDAPAIAVGRRTAAVTGAYAMDAGFWPRSSGGNVTEKPACESESTYAQDRFRAYESCRVGTEDFKCRFSSVDVLAEQQKFYLDMYHNARAAGARCYDNSTGRNQISLHFGIDDVVGVLYTKREHAPLASKYAIWLRELTGRDIPLIGMVEQGQCECAEFELAGHPLVLPQLTPPAMSNEDMFSCAQRCGDSGQSDCCMGPCSSPTVDTIASDLRMHAFYMRIPLTGAGAIECATAGLERKGLWTNLGGHVTLSADVESCMAGCRHRSPEYIVPALILTVRNPYDYWLALYQLTTQCHGSMCSALSRHLTMTNAPTNASFDTFLYSVAEAPATLQSAISQSGHIRRLCGETCNYTFLLHAETLNADYLSLLGHLNLPLGQGLPRHPLGSFDRCVNRARVYTPKLAGIVQELEGLLFEPRFGYSRHI
jgi:hypothetical protein